MKSNFIKFLKTSIILGVFSQTYSNYVFAQKPVTLVVPYGAGGSTDIIARKLATKLSDYLKTPVIVENKPGASTTIAAAYVARSKPDGTTILYADSSTFAYNKFIYKSLSYDIDLDLKPVSVLSTGSMILASSIKSNIKTIDDLLQKYSNKEEIINYASAGIGTPPHIMMESLLNKAKIKAKHIPYRGELPGLTDMMGGTIDIMFLGPRSAKELSSAGKINILGWGGAERNAIFPQLPTIGEKINGYEENLYQGIFSPAGTDDVIVNKLNSALDFSYKNTEFQNWLSAQSVGITYKTSTPNEFKNIIEREQKKAEATIKNISLE